MSRGTALIIILRTSEGELILMPWMRRCLFESWLSLAVRRN